METIKASLENVTLSKEKNKMIISGSIAKIGEPSTGSPCGANGYNICFTEESVTSCGKTFEGMPVNCVLPDCWGGIPEAIMSGHGNELIGYIRKIKPKDDNIMAEIVVWKDRNPWLADLIVNTMDSLGFSVEMYPTKTHEDDKANVQYIDEFEGVGCAMLWSSVAAFSQTFIEKIAASRSDNNMNEEMKKEIEVQVKAAVEVNAESLAKLSGAVDNIKASLEELAKMKESIQTLEELKASVEKVEAATESHQQFIDDLQASAEGVDSVPSEDIEAIKAELEVLKASVEKPAIPTPKAGQQVAENPNLEGDKSAQLKAEIEKINASNMNNMDKLRAIAKAKMNA